MRKFLEETMQIVNENQVIIDFEENGQIQTAVYLPTWNLNGIYDQETLQFANQGMIICDVLDEKMNYIGTEEFEFGYIS